MSAVLPLKPTKQKLEKIQPIRLGQLTPATLPPRPTLRWVPIDALRINRAYQRSMSERSVRLVRRMVERFDFARLKALSVLDLGDGTYEVLDGQHTAIAAMTHGGVHQLPCLISASRTTAEAAAAFVDLNRDRVSLTALQIFWAEVAAGDEVACDVAKGVEKGGGRIPKVQTAAGYHQVGDVTSLGTLKKIAMEGGWPYVRRVVDLGVRSKLKPITRDMLVAFDDLLWGKHAGKLTDTEIVDCVRTHGPERLAVKARQHMVDHAGGTIAQHLALVIARLA